MRIGKRSKRDQTEPRKKALDDRKKQKIKKRKGRKKTLNEWQN